MSKILDKFGIYDLVGVLLSGISISTFSILILQVVYEIPIELNLQINETLTFLVLSYFVGLIFQELGSLMQRIIYRNNELLKKSLKTSSSSHIYLTEIEKREVYSYVRKKLRININENDDNIVYNYCKFYVLENCKTSRINKDQSLSAMSRSLSLYFTLLFLIALITVFYPPYLLKLILIVVSFGFALLLYRRCIRFAELRYVYIFRIFYYKVVIK